MKRKLQVKCRRCRQWLMSEESIVDSHGNSVQGDMADWDCGGIKEGWHDTRTHLFVSDFLAPAFIMTAVEQASFAQGKITCPKCQGRLGSFDFVRNNRKCSCQLTLLPPIHLLHNRVDLLPSTRPSLMHSVAPVSPDMHGLKGGRLPVPEKGDAEPEGVALAGAPADAHLNDAAVEDVRSAEATRLESLPAIEDAQTGEGNGGIVQSSSEMELERRGEVADLRWLFGEKEEEPVVDTSVVWTHQSVENSESRLQNSEHFVDVTSHRNVIAQSCAPTPSVPNSEHTASSVGVVEEGVCEVHTVNPIHCRQRPYLVGNPFGAIAPYVAPVNASSPTKREKRKKRRRRKRDGDAEDEPESVPSDLSKYRAHFSNVERQREVKLRMMEEVRQAEDEEVQHDHTCAMCLDVMWSPHTVLPCGHNFCEGCLRRLTTIVSSEKSHCPMCRRCIHQCTPLAELQQILQDSYPARFKLRRRQENRLTQRCRNLPLPGLPYSKRILNHLPQPRFRFQLPRTAQQVLVVMVVIFILVTLLASLGLMICKEVLRKLAQVYDDLLERLTGERLWSHFLGMESRVLTVSCVFVLYLLVACAMHYMQDFQQGHGIQPWQR